MSDEQRGSAAYLALHREHVAALKVVEAADGYQRMIDRSDRAHLIAGWREYASDAAALLKTALANYRAARNDRLLAGQP